MTLSRLPPLRMSSGGGCCDIANYGFISLVRRWERDVHCIIGVLGRLTTRHTSCKGVGRSVIVVSRNPKMAFWPLDM